MTKADKADAHKPKPPKSRPWRGAPRLSYRLPRMSPEEKAEWTATVERLAAKSSQRAGLAIPRSDPDAHGVDRRTAEMGQRTKVERRHPNSKALRPRVR